MSGYPIVMLHGLGVDHRMWALQVASMQEEGQILVPDLPGFGRQPPLPPPWRTPVAYADWVAAWLEEQGVGPAAVLGYSMGGTIALLLALRHRHRVERLVLCCTSAAWGRGGRRWAGTVFAGLGGRAAMELFQASVAWSCQRWLPPDRRGTVLDMVRRAHRPTLRRLYLHLTALDLRPQLRQLDLPAAVIGGDRDWLAPPSHLRALARGLPQGRLALMPGAGHLLCLSHADPFTQLLRKGLGATPAPVCQRSSGANR